MVFKVDFALDLNVAGVDGFCWRRPHRIRCMRCAGQAEFFTKTFMKFDADESGQLDMDEYENVRPAQLICSDPANGAKRRSLDILQVGKERRADPFPPGLKCARRQNSHCEGKTAFTAVSRGLDCGIRIERWMAQSRNRRSGLPWTGLCKVAFWA